MNDVKEAMRFVASSSGSQDLSPRKSGLAEPRPPGDAPSKELRKTAAVFATVFRMSESRYRTVDALALGPLS